MTRQDDNEASVQMMQSDDNKMTPEKMEDKYFLCHILFYTMGTLTLVPQNFFITANDYWMYKFRDTDEIYNSSNKNRTGLQAAFTSNFTIVSHVTSIIVLIITIALAKRISIKTRILGSLGVMTFLFLLTLVFVAQNTDAWQKGFFVFTIITGSLLNGTGSVFMVTLFQLVSKFPPSYIGAQLSGQAICGIAAALIQIFSLGVGASSTINALIYFAIGALCVVTTIVLYLSMARHSSLFQYYVNKELQTQENKITLDDMKRVIIKIKYVLLTMIVVMGSSVIIHPGVTSLVQSAGKGHKWNDVFFVPVSTFLFYNLFDFVGRELSTKIKKPKSGPVMLIAGIIRITFVPLLMFCNVQPRSHLPVLFNADSVYIIMIIIFAFSNGYLVNLCIVQVPKLTEPDELKIAMFLIVLFMVVSLGACSFLTVLIVKAV